jgi:hypothetical protein
MGRRPTERADVTAELRAGVAESIESAYPWGMITTTQQMAYRRFGRTELQMPVLSCGGMRYQDGWKDKPLSEVDPENQKNLEATIHRSVELGINHIETARGYGCSERQLGLVLPRLPRDRMIIQTKVGPAEDPTQFVENFHDSMQRLQLDHVDLLAIHGINNETKLDWSIRPGGCFEAAQKLREQGKCRFIGFSTHGHPQVIMDAIKHGQPHVGEGFDYVNLHWYYIYPETWPCIEEATRRDMGVFIISPSDKGGKLYDPPQKLVELCRPLHPITFNDLWCLNHGEVHTLSVGAARPSDFDEHIAAMQYLDHPQTVLEPIEMRLQQAYRQAVEPELADPWSMDLPRWQQTPGQINLGRILQLRNLARAYDMMDFARMRYNLLGNGGDWFPGYKADKLNEDGVEADLRRELSARLDADVADKVVAALHEAHEMLEGEEKKRLSESEA